MKKLIATLAVSMLVTHLPAGLPPIGIYRITNIGNGNIQIVTTNVMPGVPLILLTSTNLADWTAISTNFTGGFILTNTVQATNPIIFYKVEEL